MRMPQIRIDSQLAQIGMRQSNGKQQIRQEKADMTIKQPKANLSIQTKDAQLTIDQTQAFAEANLMNITKRVEKFAQEGKQSLLEGMRRRSSQGKALMKIEHGGNQIAQQAKVNGHDQMKTLGLKYIPSQFSVNIHYDRADIQVNAQANKPTINVQVNGVDHDYQRGSVDIFMERYAQLDIDYINVFSASV